MRLPLILALAAITTAAAADPVTIFMYSEYIDPSLGERFKAETGHELKIEVYEAQEDMIAKLRAGATNQYDLVVASDTVIPSMIKLKLVQPIDAAAIPNKGNVDPRFVNPPYDQGNVYSWPYLWGTTGILYDTTKAPKGQAPTWKWVFDESAMFGPVVLLDEQRSIFGCALTALGLPMNSRDPAQVKAAADLLVQAKNSKRCLGFDGGVGGVNKVLAGQAAAAVVFSGDAVRAITEKPELAYAVPTEGGNIWVDCLLVTSQAPNKAGAQVFINWLLDAKNGAQNANFIRYGSPLAAAKPHLTPADLQNPAIYPDAALMQKLAFLDDLGKDTRLYNDAWTAVKSR